MYDSEFICTYKEMDTPEEQEELYKIQLLQAFCLEEWDDDAVNNTISELYNLMSLDKNVQEILIKISKVEELQLLIHIATTNSKCNKDKDEYEYEYDEDENTNNTNNNRDELNRILFSLLFKYEYFDLFHRCIYDYINHRLIRGRALNTLLHNLLAKG